MYVLDDPLGAAVLIAFFLGLAFPIHEFAHAVTAYRLGDSTPKLFGKLTLNPIAHFDRIGGSILIISVLVAGIPFGFAQTPINPRNLRGRHGDALVAAAGPLTNLLIAVAFAIPLRIASPSLLDQYPVVFELLDLVVQFSLLLGLFNLIPVPPLDGGTILLSYLSPQTAWQLRPLFSQYGMFILLLLIVPIVGGSSILQTVLFPIMHVLHRLLVGV